MTYGTSLGVAMPVVGAPGPGTALATQINATVQAIIDRLETKVTVAGMDINADLSLRSGADDFGLVDVHRVELVDVLSALSAVTYPGVLYRVGSDLYFNDAAGNQVRIVTGGGIDVSSVGGITGSGYGSGGIEVNWDGTNYRLRDGTGADDFAALECDDVLLRDGSSHKVRLGAAAMAADYNFTLPAAVPAAQRYLSMDTSGNITTTATTKRFHLAAAAGKITAGTPAATATTGLIQDNVGTVEAVFGIPLENGWRLTRVIGRVNTTSGGGGNEIVMTVKRISPAGAATTLGSVATTTGSGDQDMDSGAIAETVSTNGQSYIVHFDLNGGVGADINNVFGVDVEYDIP